MATPTHVPMRRHDRAVTDDEWIKSMLQRAPYGVIATVVGGQPYLNTNLFVYVEADNAIYLHTSVHGQTRANIAASGQVCFTVSEIGRLLPADTAMEFSVEYASVVVYGRATIIEDPEQARRGLQCLLDKYFPHLKPGKDYRPVVDAELKPTAVYRLDIERWSGKRKQVAEDFPGAFFYPNQDGITG